MPRSTMPRRALLAAALAALALAAAATQPAQAAKRCAEPSPGGFDRATPAEAGMDAAKLRQAVDYGTTQLSFSVRVYRHGCLVAADRLEPANRNAQFESWSLAKSVTAMVFGRAMTLGLINPDDPVGALIPEADRAHGAIRMRDLLTMTSGLRWNFLRDYDVAMPNRLRDALTVGIAHPPGRYYEYSQTGPALLAEAVQRAVGEDFQAFAQRELFGRLGVAPRSWRWSRDGTGHTLGFMGVNMTPEQYGRLGDLMRRGGVWKGERLLSRRFMAEALTPSATNGCYGYLTWLNAAAPCVGPRIANRPVSDEVQFPALPRDLYRFAGLLGQLVAVFPKQDVVVVRTGLDASLAGGANWEGEMYRRVLDSITDQRVDVPGAPLRAPAVDRTNPDIGLQHSLLEPHEVASPVFGLDPLPAAGPRRARAVQLRLAATRPSRRKAVLVRATCPRRADRACQGRATLGRGARPVAYRLAPGATKVLRFKLRKRPRLPVTVTAGAVNEDDAGGTKATVALTLRKR